MALNEFSYAMEGDSPLDAYTSSIPDAKWTPETTEAMIAHIKATEDRWHKNGEGKFVMQIPDSMPQAIREQLEKAGFQLFPAKRFPI